MHFTLDDIKQMTSPAAFTRGMAYFEQHKVIFSQLDAANEQIMAEVEGTEPYPYEVFLFWEDEERTSDCSCPVAYNCKHGVAAGLHWLSTHPKTQSKKQKATSSTEPDTSLSQWLSTLSDEVEHHNDEATLMPGRHYLLYQLEVHQSQHQILLLKTYLKKSGEWSQQQSIPSDHATWNVPSFYLPQDRDIVQKLQISQRQGPRQQAATGLRLAGREGARILEQLLLSQR